MPLDFQSISAIVFLILLSVLLYFKRKKLTVQGKFPFVYVLMYKTKFGLNLMESWARKYNKTLKFLGYAGIVVGFLGMILLAYALTQNVIDLFTKPEAAQGVGLVLPIQAKGVVFVPFFYWIIAIFVVILVHEFGHGVISRAHNIKVKSSGFGFAGVLIPILPLAFVEPDEKILRKRPHKQQLSVFAAGPFFNIAFGLIIVLFLLLVLGPIVKGIVEPTGVQITGFIEGDYPAKQSGIEAGELVIRIDGKEITTLDGFSDLLEGIKPGSNIRLKTNVSTYNIVLAQNPEDNSKGYLGVYVRQGSKIKDAFKDSFAISVLIWFIGLIEWIYILNIGIGLFNLIPIGPVDGGRMMQIALYKFIPNKKIAEKVWHHISLIFLLVVVFIILKACTA